MFFSGGLLERLVTRQHLVFAYIIDGVIVNELLVLLEAIEQRFIANMVNKTGNAGRNTMYVINGFIREKFSLISGICKVTAYVLFRFGTVKVRKDTVHIDSLTDSGILLKP